jgi:hypothetical protein
MPAVRRHFLSIVKQRSCFNTGSTTLKYYLKVDNVGRIQVPTAASVKMPAFWAMAPCILVEGNRSSRGAYCRHHQGSKYDEGCSTNLWNVGLLLRDYTSLYPGRLSSTWITFFRLDCCIADVLALKAKRDSFPVASLGHTNLTVILFFVSGHRPCFPVVTRVRHVSS